MYKGILTLAISISMLLVVHQAPAQTLGGSYTVGIGMNYSTITDAVAAYNSSTLTGPVVFNLTDLTYEGETYPININHNATASSTNTLTIKPAAENLSVTIQGFVTPNPDPNGETMFRLNGSDYVTIDGSHNGTNTRNLILKTHGGANRTVFWINSPSETDGAHYNTIRNCITETFIYFGQLAIFSGSPTSLGHPALSPNSNNTIEGNELKGVAGIQIIGNSPSTLDHNNIVKDNHVGAQTENGGKIGIEMIYQENGQIKNNNVQQMCTFDGGYMISLAASRHCKILGNIIHDVSNAFFTGQGFLVGIMLNNQPFNNASTPSENIIANNVIYTLQRCVSSSFTAGITFESGYDDKIVYNSVYMNGCVTEFGFGTCFMNSSWGTSRAEVRNNAFHMGGYSSSGYLMAAWIFYGSPNVTFDYNAYYVNLTGAGTALFGFGNGIYWTLADWQAGTGQDGNSIYGDPLFTSTSNLMPLNNSPLAGEATPIAEVTTDINGTSRDPLLPTIGAYELAGACDLTASAGADAQSYYGFTLNQCVTKTASTTGGEGPLTYSWTIDRPLVAGESITGALTAAVSVCLITPANLCLTVTDNNNCTATDCAMINAEDVRCVAGNSGNHKVTICHNGHNICVDNSAVPAHLAHGDYIGTCTTTGTNRAAPETKNEENGFTLFPNPGNGIFYIQQKDVTRPPLEATVRIMSTNGQVIQQFTMKNQLAKQISIGKAGVYLVQFITGNKIYSKKMIVIK